MEMMWPLNRFSIVSHIICHQSMITLRLKRFGYIHRDLPQFSDQLQTIKIKLFQPVIVNPFYVLHQLLPPIYAQPYNLQPRPHNFVLPRNR